MAEQQQPPPPQEQQYQAYAQYTHPVPQQAQPYDPNQQQAAVPYDPSYEAHYAAYYRQQQQYYDPNAYNQQQHYQHYAQTYPHHQPDTAQTHTQQFDPASYHHYPPSYPEANASGRGSGPPLRAHGNRGGRHGRGRGRGRNPNRIGPTMPPPGPKLPVIKIWCDVCRVECSSRDILEQHRNGKRHKKTVQKLEEMQKQQNMFADYQANFMPGTVYPNEHQTSSVPSAVQTTVYQQENPNFSAVIHGAPEVTEQMNVSSVPDCIVAAAEASSAQVLDPAISSEVVAANIIVQVDVATKSHPVENEQNSEADLAATEVTDHTNLNQTDGKRVNIKRKATKYGRGGKKQRKFDPHYVPEPPRVCTLCNVTCETQTGFDTHIAGKKHSSRFKRLQHHGATFGPITVYIPPNQPTPYPIRGPDPIYYGLGTFNMVNQVAFNVEGVDVGALDIQDAPLVFVQKAESVSDEKDDVVKGSSVCEAEEATTVDLELKDGAVLDS